MQSRNALQHKNFKETLHNCVERERREVERKIKAVHVYECMRAWNYANSTEIMCFQMKTYMCIAIILIMNSLAIVRIFQRLSLARSITRSHSLGIVALGRLEVN